MNEKALESLEELKSADLFAKVGSLDIGAAKVLQSWDDAIRSCSSIEWENFCLEAMNQIGNQIRPRFLHRYAEWNSINAETKEFVIPILKAKYEPVAKRNNLPDAFGDTVRWDALGYFTEVAYSDIIAPGFYHLQWQWYMKGHFPCGWEGQYPDGRPIIY